MTSRKWHSAWHRLNSKTDRVRARYFRFVQWLTRNQPIPF